MCAGVLVHECPSSMGHSYFLSYCPSSLTCHLTFLRQGLSLNLELADTGVLAGQGAPGICLTLSRPPGLSCKHTEHRAFMWVLESQPRVLTLAYWVISPVTTCAMLCSLHSGYYTDSQCVIFFFFRLVMALFGTRFHHCKSRPISKLRGAFISNV